MYLVRLVMDGGAVINGQWVDVASGTYGWWVGGSVELSVTGCDI